MSIVPTSKAVIGQYVNGRNAVDDFLQLASNHGGTVFGWIDANGVLQGTLAGFVSSLPATCTPGLTPPVVLTVAPYTINYCSAVNTWTSVVAGSSMGSAGQTAYFSGLNSITGGTVELDMAGIAGADLGAQMINCMAALPAAGGKCKGDNLAGAQTLSTAVTTNKAVVFTFCGQQITQTANISLSADNSAIVGCAGASTIFTKGANIDQITVNGAQVVAKGLTLEGTKASFTGNGIATASGASGFIIEENVIQDQANDAIKDEAGPYAGGLITGNSIFSWGVHAYESTGVAAPRSNFSNNYILGDGTATGSAILNNGECSILNNSISDSNALATVDTTGAGQGHVVSGNQVTQSNNYPAIKTAGESMVSGNYCVGGGTNGPCILVIGTGAQVLGNNVNVTNGDGIGTTSAQSFVISDNRINLNLSGVSNKAGIRCAGDQINGRTSRNIIGISCNSTNLNYGIANVPTGTHNLGMVFDGDTVSTTLSGGATVNTWLLDNTAGLNTNWQVTVQNLGCVHNTKVLQRIDAQNNKTLYLNIQPEDASVANLDVGTGSNADVFAFDNLNFTFATLPSPAGNGSRFYCTDCTQAKPTAGSGGGAFVVREAGQWNGL